MSRVRFAKPTTTKRRPRRSRAVPDELSVLLERIDAGVFSGAEVDAIERLMSDAIETLMARGKAKQETPANSKALPARPHRDSNR